jgi:hypothetical protein
VHKHQPSITRPQLRLRPQQRQQRYYHDNDNGVVTPPKARRRYRDSRQGEIGARDGASRAPWYVFFLFSFFDTNYKCLQLRTGQPRPPVPPALCGTRMGSNALRRGPNNRLGCHSSTTTSNSSRSSRARDVYVSSP